MDPNFYKSDSKFKQMLQLLKPSSSGRGSGDFSKLSLGNLSSKKEIPKESKMEETGFFPKLRHSVHFTGNFLDELKNFNSSPGKKLINQPDQLFETKKELKRKISEGDDFDLHSFVIDSLAPKDEKEIVSLFLPNLEEFKNVSETEYTTEDNHVDKTDSGSDNDIFESSHALEESLSDLDHPEILKLYQK
jgi:hypothetical protein